MTSGEDLEKSGFSYIANTPELEEENYLLRQTIEQLNKDLERHKQFKEEIDRFRQPALMVAEVVDLVNEHAVIRVLNGNKFLVTVSGQVPGLQTGDSVLVEQKNLTVVDKIQSNKQFNVEKYVIVEKPDLTWDSIGGLAEQKNELREVIEVPLLQPDIFRKIGIQPPKGVLLHGPPGTGKTLMAKALANSSHATFIQIVGSELVQKFIGEGAKMVKEIFQLAREKAPSIVFIDELDSLAAKRIDMGTSGEREVQRTFMQLLAEIDGFKNLDNVKVIAATNRIDTLDPAVLRPGRLDRLILVPNPSSDGIKEVFKIHSKKMNVKKTDYDNLYRKLEGFSGAEIQSVCTEAGYFAMRDDRTHIVEDDFLKAIRKVKKEEKHQKDLHMFG